MSLSAEVETIVEGLERLLSQVKNHPLQEFRDYGRKLEADIEEWKHPSPVAAPTAEEIAAAQAAKAAADEAASLAAADAAKAAGSKS